MPQYPFKIGLPSGKKKVTLKIDSLIQLLCFQAVLDEAEICKNKMDMATALISGLGGERVRWTEQSAMFRSEIDRLVGDVLLLTGFLSYSGPFNQEYRTLLQKSWVELLILNNIPVSADVQVTTALADIATV